MCSTWVRGEGMTQISRRRADCETIGGFARTCDGSQYWGSFETCPDVANARRRGGKGVTGDSLRLNASYTSEEPVEHCLLSPTEHDLWPLVVAM
jgi:hypothetical protein